MREATPRPAEAGTTTAGGATRWICIFLHRYSGVCAEKKCQKDALKHIGTSPARPAGHSPGRHCAPALLGITHGRKSRLVRLVA